MKENPIALLSDVVDELRVSRPYDAATVTRWQSCPLAEFRERYTLKALPEEHHKLLSDALTQWRTHERRVLHLFDDSPEKFDTWFTSERESLLQGRPVFGKHWREREQKRLMLAGEASRRVLRNYWTAVLFGIYLPLSVPQSRVELATVGVRMAAINFLEYVAKLQDLSHEDYLAPKGLKVDFEDPEIRRADAIWLRARELQTCE